MEYTSHDQHFIQYAFDVLLNGELNKNSAVIACHRGLEAIVKDGARFTSDGEECILKFDECDARHEVNRLVSMLRTEGPWTYFVTLTCNDSRTFAVALIRHAIREISDDGNTQCLENLLQN